MIDAQVKIHDKTSVEFKIGFYTDNKGDDLNEFRINTWIFVPNSLDINHSTYDKSQFYKDVRNNIRLITPIYSLDTILKEGRGPFRRLREAIEILKSNPSQENKDKYIYHIRMSLCIVKSSLRTEVQKIMRLDEHSAIDESINHLVTNLELLIRLYRSLKIDILQLPEDFQVYFNYGDEFLGNTIEQHLYALLRFCKASHVDKFSYQTILIFLNVEKTYKQENGYAVICEGDDKHNSRVIAQRNLLKKFIESDLYLRTVKKQDGAFIRQFYYSIAAGIAMIFATVISFFATQRYGNFTTDLFIILVVSYMMKDRIKDLARYYFSSQLSQRYFDNKWKLNLQEHEIGWIKEAFDFVEEGKIPNKIVDLRRNAILVDAERQGYDEKVILYRKMVNLSREEIEEYKDYRLAGVNDITRFNLSEFMRKMDDATIPIYTINEHETDYICLTGSKLYSLYFVLQLESEGKISYKKYRLLFNRNGISDVSELA